MTVALIAGEGGLPRHVANALGRAGRDWFACHLQDHPPTGVGQSRPFRIEHLGSFIAALRDRDVAQVCFAGRVARPTPDPSQIDAATAPMMARIADAIASGDDAALRTVIDLFEEGGLTVVAPHEVAPDLIDVPAIGTPTDGDRADIERGHAVLSALGPVDVGQACIVAAGQVLAVEALPGTDWMLATLAPPPPRAPQAQEGGGFLGGVTDWLSGPGPAAPGLPDFPRPAGGVLVKAPKPAQDRRIDLPAIGPDTVRRAAAARLNGIAVERGGVMVIDRGEVAQIARGAGLFIHAFDP
ncbi:LpxI family protein [Jannaschia sp. LMIT008]|uniref:LpxI family protein n=1 Tax=Jannaschia maritima TaxID=3032585 RepID=UPI0028124DA0|nr:UDP-2,3-diacylglucosamine diphosphatase LpxI [Jannaschia sp. LMIT008]